MIGDNSNNNTNNYNNNNDNDNDNDDHNDDETTASPHFPAGERSWWEVEEYSVEDLSCKHTLKLRLFTVRINLAERRGHALLLPSLCYMIGQRHGSPRL